MKINSFIGFPLLSVFLLLMANNRAFSSLAAEPTIQTLSFTSNPGGCNEIDLNFVPGDGTRRIIIGRPDAAVNQFPVDGIGYSSGSLFGSGSNLGNNNYVVYNASGTQTTITGLDGGREYYFAIFELNGTGSNSNYLLTGYLQTNGIAPGFTISVSSSSGDMCEDDSVELEAHGANSYLWSPSGSLSSSTDSVVWATPSSTTQYTIMGFDTASGCTDSKNITITVYQLPNVTLGSFSNKCENGSNVNLTSGSPSGGVYSGNGVVGTQFRPADAGVGQHWIKYSYSDIHGCSSSDSSSINVLSAPDASFATLNDVCIDAPAFTLTGGTPVGGTYGGTGVSSGQFNPAVAGVGQFQLRYVYVDANGCRDTSFELQEVFALPVVEFATLSPVCLNVPPFTLTQGTPAGGDYSGVGVSNSQFSPLVSGAGTFILNYNYTDSNGCSAEDTSYITVNTLPSVNFSSLSPRCQNGGPLTLTGGTPAGGVYSGPGVGGGVFYSAIAGAGQHTITYTYTNVNNCSNTATQPITVNPKPLPNLGPDVTVCANSFTHLTAGNFTTYLWSTGANTSSINVDSAGRGLGTFPITITVTNNFGCANKDTVLVTFDNCTGIFGNTVNENMIEVYPNPSSGNFTVVAEAGSDLSLFNLKGELLLEEKNISSLHLIREDLARGAYLVLVRKDQKRSYQLIIKN
jgi:hypothetical protein